VNYEIRPATLADIRVMARAIRPMDRAEIEGWGLKARHLLHDLYRDSPVRRVALVGGEVAAVWGVQTPVLGSDGAPWLFTAPSIERAKIAFLRETRREINEMLVIHGRLRCYVLASYTRSIRFFAALGFTFGPPEPVGVDGVAYRLMTIWRHPPPKRPFIVYGLPRSRTFWLSRFLSYGDWECHHETAIRMRGIEDIAALFSQPGTGTAETAAAPGWRVLHHHVPDLRAVVVRRPVEQVMASLARLDLNGAFVYDLTKLRKNMERISRALDQIARLPGALVVDHDDLDREDVCAEIFTHCLSIDLPRDWWLRLRGQNLQTDAIAVLRYYFENQDKVERFKKACRTELSRLVRSGAINREMAA